MPSHISRCAALLLLMFTSACAHTNQTWVRNYEGNQLEVSSGYMGDKKDNKPYITITNTNRTWVGPYKGGEPMVPVRKQFLLGVAQAEAKQYCQPKMFSERGSPDYVMLDRSPNVFGGGLVGYALASAMSEYDNLPTAVQYRFTCTNDPTIAVMPQAVPAPTTAASTLAAQPATGVAIAPAGQVPAAAPAVATQAIAPAPAVALVAPANVLVAPPAQPQLQAPQALPTIPAAAPVAPAAQPLTTGR